MAKGCQGTELPVYRLALEKKGCFRADTEKMRTPGAVTAWVARHYGCRPQEYFLALLLNNRGEVLGVHEAHIGAISEVSVDPKVVFSAALLAGATGIVLVHNHPSGAPEPSDLDKAITRQMHEAGKMLGIRVLDHVVIARGAGSTSMQEKGMMPLSGLMWERYGR